MPFVAAKELQPDIVPLLITRDTVSPPSVLLVTMLPKASFSDTTGCVVNASVGLALATPDGSVVNEIVLGEPDPVTVIPPLVAETNPLAEAFKV
jgi:hypothetical protein